MDLYVFLNLSILTFYKAGKPYTEKSHSDGNLIFKIAIFEHIFTESVNIGSQVEKKRKLKTSFWFTIRNFIFSQTLVGGKNGQSMNPCFATHAMKVNAESWNIENDLLTTRHERAAWVGSKSSKNLFEEKRSN